MRAEDEIIKIINGMSGSYAPYNIFSDWVEMSALAVQNAVCFFHNDIWQKREQQYIDLAKRYTEKELERFAQMFVLLGEALEEDLTDVLGSIYMRCSLGNKYTGQFFTPFHLSCLVARLAIECNNDEATLHESIATTQIYLDVMDEELENAHKKFTY